METFSDFSQLKANRHATPPPPRPVQPAPETRQQEEAASATDFFAAMLSPGPSAARTKAAGAPVRRTTVVTPNTIARVREEQAAEAFEARRVALQAEIDRLKEELEIEQAVKDALAKDLAEARETAQSLQSELDGLTAGRARAAAERDAAQAERDAARVERDAAQAERNALRAELAQAKARAEQVPRQTPPAAAADGLLGFPSSLTEKFAGEIREHLLETLAAAHAAAETGGRDRRARILEAVLCMNPLSGELERRRARVKQIIKDAGSALGPAAIAELERLGFRYVSGNKHHKLEWAGIRFPLAKTPGDFRACLNSAAEIGNRVF
ncbi:MAG: hypothetical protein ACI4Q3_02775 [Kiritimatiellia bacterium]